MYPHTLHLQLQKPLSDIQNALPSICDIPFHQSLPFSHNPLQSSNDKPWIFAFTNEHFRIHFSSALNFMVPIFFSYNHSMFSQYTNYHIHLYTNHVTFILFSFYARWLSKWKTSRPFRVRVPTPGYWDCIPTHRIVLLGLWLIYHFSYFRWLLSFLLDWFEGIYAFLSP